MLKDYFAWWTKQMRQWVPAGFVDTASGAPVVIILPSAGGAVTAILRQKWRNEPIGTFQADIPGLRALNAALSEQTRRHAIVLRLPGESLLEREVVLPLVAEREVERILTFEMDRFTPFASTSVYWTYSVSHRDGERKKLHLRLSMVTRSAVATLLAGLQEVGRAATALEVPRADAAICRIALQRPDTRELRRGRLALTAAAAVCMALAVATVAAPFVLQSVALEQVEARIEANRPAVNEADALQRRLNTATAGVDVFAAEQARIGDALTVLAAVTENLPDDTYLTDLTLRQGKLTINGQSAAAVRLIAALTNDKVLRNPEFVAPVNRIDGGRADVFVIRAEVAH